MGSDKIDNMKLKMLYKGKRLDYEKDGTKLIFPNNIVPKKVPKIMIMASSNTAVRDLNSKKSDPTIRGLDQERELLERQKQKNHNNSQSAKKNNMSSSVWENYFVRDKNYKFCRFRACTRQSFGHRS